MVEKTQRPEPPVNSLIPPFIGIDIPPTGSSFWSRHTDLAIRLSQYLRSAKHRDPDVRALADDVASALRDGSHLELNEFHFLLDQDVVHVADIDSAQTYWHGGCVLEPNTLYRVRMSFDSRWTINRNVTSGGRDGRGNVGYSTADGGIGSSYGPIDADEWPAGVPDYDDTYNPTPTTWRWAIYPGWVYVLIWQDHRNAIVKRLRPPEYEFRAGAEGASIHFLIADISEAYGDNAGTCRIRIVKVT